MKSAWLLPFFICSIFLVNKSSAQTLTNTTAMIGLKSTYPETLFLVDNDVLWKYRISYQSKPEQLIGQKEKAWTGMISMALGTDMLLLSKNKRIKRVNMGTGHWSPVLIDLKPPVIIHTFFNSIYYVSNKNLFVYSEATEKKYRLYKNHDKFWTNCKGFTSFGTSALFVINEDKLYQLPGNFNNQNPKQVDVSTDWSSIDAMATLENTLYVVKNSQLFRVTYNFNYEESNWEGPLFDISQTRNGKVWNDTKAMAQANKSLYIVQNNRLHHVSTDPSIDGYPIGHWTVVPFPKD